jgi:hypothetical protein
LHRGGAADRLRRVLGGIVVTHSTLAKPRIFYGWFVVAGTFAVTFVGFG